MSIRLFARSELARLGDFMRVTSYTISRPPIDAASARASDPDKRPQLTLVDVYRKDAVAALLHLENPERPPEQRHSIFLVRQFRFSTTIDAATGDPDLEKDGLLTELMAGVCNPGEPLLETLIRETREETGFRITGDDVEHIASFYPSPGACSEQIHLYYARVQHNADEENRSIFGYDAEEDIERLELPVARFLEMVRDNTIMDAKALVAAAWIERNRSRFGL